MFELVRNFGPGVAISLSSLALMGWLVKVLLSHFLKTIDQATTERKEITDNFTATINTHIKNSTEKSIEQTGVLKGLINQFIDMREENRRYHKA